MTPSQKRASLRGARKRERLAARDGWTCCYCKRALDSALASLQLPSSPTIEHVVPVSLGGGNGMENLKLACFPCNNGRGNGRPPKKNIKPAKSSRRSPIRDACVVCGGRSEGSLYCERHKQS